MKFRDPLFDLLDNPILTKHVRTRLRRNHLIAYMACLLVVYLLAAWCITQTPATPSDVLPWFIGLQVFLLTFMGAVQVSNSIWTARQTGMMDFHRAAPQRPFLTALGFLVGAPIREAILAAGLAPFIFLCAWASDIALPRVAGLELILATSSLLYFCVAGLVSLALPKSRSGVIGTITTVVVLGVSAVGFPGQRDMNSILSSLSIVPTADALMGGKPAITFFQYAMHPVTISLLSQVVVVALLFSAIVRKIGSEADHMFSRPQSVVFLLTVAVLALGSNWNFFYTTQTPVGGPLYTATLTACLLVCACCSNRAEFSSGVRRSIKKGRTAVTAWADGSSSLVPQVVLSAIVLLTGLLAYGISGYPSNELYPAIVSSNELYPAIVSSIVAASATLGLGAASQYVLLRFGVQGVPFLAMFVLVLWVAPIIAMTPASGSVVSEVIGCISPIFSIGALLGTRPEQYAGDAIIAIGVNVPLALAFLALTSRSRQKVVAAITSLNKEPAKTVMG